MVVRVSFICEFVSVGGVGGGGGVILSFEQEIIIFRE